MSKLRYSVLSRGAKRASSNLGCSSAVNWSNYYQNHHHVYIENDVFNVFTIGANGPLLLLIHGGGYSALTWSLFAEEITQKVECQVLAVDLRGHGSTKTHQEDNLTLDVLVEDISSVVKKLYPIIIPPTVIIGHSLGGAVAVSAASYIENVVGLCVIDVVEATALESLSSMQSILRSRPSSFKTIEHAILWSYKTGQTHNMDAARVSMPGQVKNISTGCLAADEDETTCQNGNSSGEKRPHVTIRKREHFSYIEKIDEDKIFNVQPTCHQLNNEKEIPLIMKPPPFPTKKPPLPPTFEGSHFNVPEEDDMYTWRIDLSKTEPFWTGWFKGLSKKFLDLPLPKVLLIANINRLDTALTVGQMQGKFQFHVLSRSGHAIHEDQPQEVADIIAGFLVKQKIAAAKKGYSPIMPAC